MFNSVGELIKYQEPHVVYFVQHQKEMHLIYMNFSLDIWVMAMMALTNTFLKLMQWRYYYSLAVIGIVSLIYLIKCFISDLYWDWMLSRNQGFVEVVSASCLLMPHAAIGMELQLYVWYKTKFGSQILATKFGFVPDWLYEG